MNRRITFFSALLLGAAALVPMTANAGLVSGTHYYDAKSKVCTNALFCNMAFTSVPVGKTAVITRVTCYITMTKTSSPRSLMFFRQGPGGSNWNQFVALPQRTSESGSSAAYNINSDVHIVVKGGESPAWELNFNQLTANAQAQCSVTGSVS